MGMFGTFEVDETVEVGKRGRKALEIDADIRKAWESAIAAGAWDRYYSTVVRTEKTGAKRSAAILVNVLKRDLSKLRKEYADAGKVYRLSMVTKDEKPESVTFAFRVYPAES